LIEDIPITLPKEHLLDWYQKIHPLYDRFLPALAAQLPENSTVIDVGANVGDSAIPFLKRNIRTYCVEPAAYFIKYLHKNLQTNGFLSKAVIINKLISSNASNKQLNVERGTAFVSDKENPQGKVESVHHSISLNELIDQTGQVTLIKSDTDGFDHDVLESGLIGIARHLPMIYFENTVTSENKTGYESVYDALMEMGYDHVVIFDNQGNIMFNAASWLILKQLNTYMMSAGIHGVPYLDILTYRSEHTSIVASALQTYSNLV
jgi:FkbM family methyltransferase